MIRKLFLLALAFAFTGILTAQKINTAKLDSLFTAIERNNKSMGSVAILNNGAIVYQRSLGHAALKGKEKIAATKETKYRIGSITKMFTAVLVFQQIENGKLKLENKLSEWFPLIPNAEKITIKHLLTHHSGIYNFTNDSLYESWEGMAKSRDEMLEIIKNTKPAFEPGSKGEYSNSNFVLLGYILEKVSGKTYKELLRTGITSKLNLTSTYYGGPVDVLKNEAFSFEQKNGWSEHTQTDMSIPGGAGAIVSNPADLVKFAVALFEGKLLKPASLSSMQEMKGGFGSGLFKIPFYEKSSFGHGGGIDAFSSLLAYFPVEKIAIAYTSNGNGGMSTNDVIIGILSIVFNRDYVIPDFKAVEIPKEELDKFTGEYSSSELPLKIRITKEDGKLIAQATGQSAFPLEALSKNEFEFAAAGIKIIFNSDEKRMTLNQGGASYNFTKY